MTDKDQKLADVIPINRAETSRLIKAFEEMSANLSKRLKPTREQVSAIFVDKKGFKTVGSVSYPPPREYFFPVTQTHSSAKMDDDFRYAEDITTTRVVFLYYRTLDNNLVEYREK